MSSIRKRTSARLNGAKGGPKTPEGKQRSSQNAITHGLCATAPCIPGEDPEAFNRHRDEILARYPEAEPITLEHLVNNSWRIRRAWRVENTAITESMDDVIPKLEKIYEEYSEDVRLYTAYRTLLEKSNLLPFVNRVETQLARSIRQNLKALNEKCKNEPNYPQTGVFE